MKDRITELELERLGFICVSLHGNQFMRKQNFFYQVIETDFVKFYLWLLTLHEGIIFIAEIDDINQIYTSLR